MKHIENIVIGKPLVKPSEIFALDETDWERTEKDKTLWTESRSIASIMKDLGIVKSIGEVRRNKPQLCVPQDKPDYKEIKWGKTKLFVLVGE